MELILTNDVLNHLEKQFGQRIRQLGSFYSDGVFAYISIPMTAVRKAADVLGDSGPLDTPSSLDLDPNRLPALTQCCRRQTGPPDAATTDLNFAVASVFQRVPGGGQYDGTIDSE